MGASWRRDLLNAVLNGLTALARACTIACAHGRAAVARLRLRSLPFARESRRGDTCHPGGRLGLPVASASIAGCSPGAEHGADARYPNPHEQIQAAAAVELPQQEGAALNGFT